MADRATVNLKQREWRANHRDKVNQHQRDYYKKHGDQVRAYKRKWDKSNTGKRSRQKSWDRKRAFIRSEKEVPCVDCGQVYPFYCMDFDHVRGEKRFTLGGSGAYSFGLPAIRTEIEKCEVVCANCHRRRTYERSNRDSI